MPGDTHCRTTAGGEDKGAATGAGFTTGKTGFGMTGAGVSAWWHEAWQQAANRRALRHALREAPAPGFVAPPEPRTIGLHARGRQLIAGNFLFAGHLIEAPGISPWDIASPSAGFDAALQGFTWLDDLAAVGDAPARDRAQSWTFGWITRFGSGEGPGWQPELTGRRLIRLINHAALVLPGRAPEKTAVYYRALSAQIGFLARRWHAAEPGPGRIEALTGLICAALALKGKEGMVAPASAALAKECTQVIDPNGGIPSRNPEDLLEVFTLLTWAGEALTGAGRAVPEAHVAAIGRIAPTLRSLRHADGGLARFHGGGRGLEGRLDQALAQSGIRPVAHHVAAMGFVRLSGGRTSVVADAAAPPGGTSAHASTLAFEMTSGRRPLIVSCGSGAPFGPDWQRASRATQSHSTLSIEGYSSSRFGRSGADALNERAAITTMHSGMGPEGSTLLAGHNGWQSTHGLVHLRDLSLSPDGRRLDGVDMLIAGSQADRRRLGALLRRMPGGLPFSLRFHLHPDADAEVDMGGAAASVALRSGEIWVLRHDGGAQLRLEPSVCLEKGRLLPRAARQIVLSAYLKGPEARIGWTLAKAQDSALPVRDYERADLPDPGGL